MLAIIFNKRAAVLVIAAFASLSATAQSHCQSYWTAAYKCAQGCGCGGGSGGGGGGGGENSSYDREAAEIAAHNKIVDRYNAKLKESDSAKDAGRYREAARLRREAVKLHEPLGDNQASRNAQAYAERLEQYADADDAAKAGNAALAAGNLEQAIAYYQKMIRDPGFDNDGNRNLIAKLQARLQAEREQKAAAEKYRIEREAQDIKTAAIMSKRIEGFAATLDTGAPTAGKFVTQAGTTGDAQNTHKANAPVLDFGDPNAPEALSMQARQGFDREGRLKGSKAVPPVSTANIRSKPASSLALAALIPEQAKGDPIVKKSLDWYTRLDTMKTETSQKIAAIKEQQKTGSGDATVLSAQLGTLENDNKRIENDQAKAKATIKKQVKNLGLEWNESTVTDTKEGGK